MVCVRVRPNMWTYPKKHVDAFMNVRICIERYIERALEAYTSTPPVTQTPQRRICIVVVRPHGADDGTAQGNAQAAFHLHRKSNGTPNS